MNRCMYTDGAYLERHPTWGLEDAEYKTNNIVRLIDKHQLSFHTYAEVGCGAGKILHCLSKRYPMAVFHGYDISPQAIALAKNYETSRVSFFEKDIFLTSDMHYDIIALIDVIEHIEDYMSFLRRIRRLADKFIFVIPLEMTVSSVLRNVVKDARQSVGHVHSFMKDTALASLVDAGYDIVDWWYTTPGLDYLRTPQHKIAWLPRRILYTVNRDICVRLLGGFPMIVLAQGKLYQ